jgi:transposase InsO family protein
MIYPLVRDLAAEGVPVRLACGVLGFSAQAYYAWVAAPVSLRDLEDAYLTNALVDAHEDDPAFGYRFLADELEHAGMRVAGRPVGERRVWRLCSQQRIWSTTVRKGRRGSGKTPGPAVHDDHVERRFTAAAPNRVWVTDITEHPTSEGKVYCCAIKDLFSNRIVGYATDQRMTADLAVTALRAAIARRRPASGPGQVVLVHSDRGAQFRARSFRAVLKAAGLQGSMGRVAAAADNAAMESFWALLQKNVLNQRRWHTRAELTYAITYWIEHTYNRRRRQRRLGRLTPVEFELAFAPETTTTAA